MNKKGQVQNILMIVITVVIAAIVIFTYGIPQIKNSYGKTVPVNSTMAASGSSNLSSAEKGLAALIPMLFIVGLLLVVAAWAFYSLKSA
jgi:hypothetical protein